MTTSLPMPRLSIIIVTYNSTADVDACLGSLVQHPPSTDHEIVVVDNASTDGTAATVRARWHGVRVIDSAVNVGFARANNVGIRQTLGSLILLLNPDTSAPAGALDTLVSALDARPDVAVTGPRLVDAQGRAELSFGRMLSPFAELRQKFLVEGSRRPGPIAAYVESITRKPQEVDWVSGACLLVRRADVEAVGLMDERFFLYAEDVDLCASIRARGRRVLFCPAAEIVHLRGRSRATASAPTEHAYRRSQLAFYQKHHPEWVPWLRWYLKVRGRLPDNPTSDG
jgi:N-acetylglucosaminyl-diphospho-decaprenol L-rhamnosyltransferase